MKNIEIEKIIVKYINKEANQTELKKLDKWLKDEQNIALFNKYVKIEYLTTINLSNYNLKNAKIAINTKNKRNRKVIRNVFFKKISVAASIILLLGFSFSYFFNDNTNKNIVSTSKIIESKSNKTILTLNNGKNITLGSDKNYSSNKVKENGKELLYSSNNSSNSSSTKLIYNYLTIPRGGDFFVQLSDGTKVWLNSDSKLKYPENFNNGETRKVELIYGEAYFEVSPSSKHNGDSFKVITKNQEVNVLGTHFNVKAYKEDTLISTTLLEGKVRVNRGLKAVLLKPNQQSKISTATKNIEVVEVDVFHEVAWIKGIFSFNQEPLDEIMKVLSRRYNIDVSFESEKAKKYQFTVILKRETTIKEILKFFESTSNGDLKYTINNKKIVIK